MVERVAGKDALDRLPEDLPHVQIDPAHRAVVIDVVVEVEPCIQEEQQRLGPMLVEQHPLPIEKRVVKQPLDIDRADLDAAHIGVARHVIEVVGRVHAVEHRLEHLDPGRGRRARQVGLGDQVRDPARIDPLAGQKRTGGAGTEGGDDGSQLAADQGTTDHLVVDRETVEVVLVEEVAERPVADVMQQARHPQRLLDASRRRHLADQGVEVRMEPAGPLAAQVHGAERVLEARMLAAGEDPPGRLELVDPPQPLQPWVIEQVLLSGHAVAADPLGDLDVAVQRIGHQVHRVVVAGEISHEFGNILMT